RTGRVPAPVGSNSHPFSRGSKIRADLRSAAKQEGDVPTLFVVGGGLFGSLAAAWARRQGVEAVVVVASLDGAASPAAAGLSSQRWAGKKLSEHFGRALPLLECLYEIRSVSLRHDDGSRETLLCVPPSIILESTPVRERVTAVGDGWLEAEG